MDSVELVQENTVKWDEIKQKPAHTGDEKEETNFPSCIPGKSELSTFESTAGEQITEEEEELEQPYTAFLVPKVEIEEDTEEQEDDADDQEELEQPYTVFVVPKVEIEEDAEEQEDDPEEQSEGPLTRCEEADHGAPMTEDTPGSGATIARSGRHHPPTTASMTTVFPAARTVADVPASNSSLPAPASVAAAVHTSLSVAAGSSSQITPRELLRRHRCLVCGNNFLTPSKLAMHMRAHTGDRPFECKHCGKAFTQKIHLQIHLHIHTGTHPYKCEHCGKAYTNKCNLQVHLRTHTGDRPYKCERCDKAFTEKSNLQRHLIIHTGDRPFKCEHCEKAFTRKSKLQMHMRIHAGDKCTQIENNKSI